jgi:iron(III) transport system permease protein
MRTSLVFLLGLPLLGVVFLVLREPTAWSAYAEFDRIAQILGTSTLLGLLASVIAIALGLPLALMLSRTKPLGLPVLRFLVLAGLFVPLPVWAVAWQVVFAYWLPPLSLEPGVVAWRAWTTGLVPAAWVHGVAATPWVALLADVVLRDVDKTLEDDARMLQGQRGLLKLVLLPKVLGTVLVGLAWVLVQTLTEIPVTDAMMVRTFAEEVYTQLVGGGPGAAGAVALSLPVWLLSGAVFCVLVKRRSWPTIAGGDPWRFQTRLWPTVLSWVIVGIVVLMPLLALVRIAGGKGVDGFLAEMDKVCRSDGLLLLQSLFWAVVSGVCAAWLARWCCGRAAVSRSFATVLLVLCSLLLLLPGPVLGLALKTLILQLVKFEALLLPSGGPLASLLYDRASPVPAMWVGVVRFFPVACLLIWPSSRAVSRDLLEASLLDGDGWPGQWNRVMKPATRRSTWLAVLAVTGCSLMEVSASKLVAPPGYESFVLRLFAQMHYGAESTVAALALLQCVVCAAMAGVFGRLQKT